MIELLLSAGAPTGASSAPVNIPIIACANLEQGPLEEIVNPQIMQPRRVGTLNSGTSRVNIALSGCVA